MDGTGRGGGADPERFRNAREIDQSAAAEGCWNALARHQLGYCLAGTAQQGQP